MRTLFWEGDLRRKGVDLFDWRNRRQNKAPNPVCVEYKRVIECPDKYGNDLLDYLGNNTSTEGFSAIAAWGFAQCELVPPPCMSREVI